MLDVSDHDLLVPIESASQLDKRCEDISARILHYRTCGTPRLVLYYLTQYLDSYIPEYRVRHNLQANPTVPPSQTNIINYVEHNLVNPSTVTAAISGVVYRAYCLFQNQKFNIKHRPTDLACVDFARICIRISKLGNYTHAQFEQPQIALYIRDRITIIDDDFNDGTLLTTATDVAIAEYGTSIIQGYPNGASGGTSWHQLVALSQRNANVCLRGSDLSDVHRITSDIKPSSSVKRHRIGMQIVFCAKQTGTLTAYRCFTCNTMTAYVNDRPRGFQRMSIAVCPFSTLQFNNTVYCGKCSNASTRIDLSSKMILYPGKYILVVCPVCNFLASHNTFLITTVCRKCALKSELAQAVIAKHTTCYFDHRRISGEIKQQVLIDRSNIKLILLPSCSYHYSYNAIFLPN